MGSLSLFIASIALLTPVDPHQSYSQRKCDPGFVSQGSKCVHCPQNTYWLKRQGQTYCERCTGTCSAYRNLVEVRDCTDTTNRKCHCKAGFYCASTAQYTCRRCKPCPEGTFSANSSLSGSCQAYTDCTTLGMAVVTKGNKTHDQACGSVTSRVLSNPRMKASD